jgi:hypothetical protein
VGVLAVDAAARFRRMISCMRAFEIAGRQLAEAELAATELCLVAYIM